MVFSHNWNLSPSEALRLQLQLAKQVRTEDIRKEIKTVAGIDVGYSHEGRRSHAAIVVCQFRSLDIIEKVTASLSTPLPYIPGLLSFREIPAILEAYTLLKAAPDLLLCDGQGIAHPRRLGIASHLGLYLDKPSIGVAKKRLIGEHNEVGKDRGSEAYLKDGNETVGVVYRSRSNVKPIYISPGHNVSVERAVNITCGLITKYRLPEPIRYAHRLASEHKH